LANAWRRKMTPLVLKALVVTEAMTQGTLGGASLMGGGGRASLARRPGRAPEPDRW
jgi:hypothetical protein